MKFRPFETIFETPFFKLQRGISAIATEEHPYYRITGAESVIGMVLDNEDYFCMVKQYRPNLEAVTVECPAGGVEPGETPLEAMHRELAEELGSKWKLLNLPGQYCLMMNRTNIKDHLFFGMSPSCLANRKPEDGIEVIKIKRNQLVDSALSGHYQQLAGVAIVQLSSTLLNVDMVNASFEEIQNKFLMHYEMTAVGP